MKIIKTTLWLFVALIIIACQKDDKFFNTGCCLTEAVADWSGNSRFYLPNIFTPNGDGVNDYFYVLADSSLKVVLFEIRGKKDKVVYQAQDILANDYSKGWDGKVNGNVVKGLYSVTLVVEAFDGTRKEYESRVCNFPCGQADEVTSLLNCLYQSQLANSLFGEHQVIDPLPECHN